MRDFARAKRYTYSICHWCDWGRTCNKKCFKNRHIKGKMRTFLKKEAFKELNDLQDTR